VDPHLENELKSIYTQVRRLHENFYESFYLPFLTLEKKP
jgi:hypothetical protein